MKYLVLLAILGLALGASAKSYTGYAVIRTHPTTEKHVQILENYQKDLNLDFWTESRKGSGVDILVSPKFFVPLTSALAKFGMETRVIIRDVQRLIDDQFKQIEERRNAVKASGTKAFDYENYHTYEEIVAHVTELAATSDLVSYNAGGVTFQGRDIPIVTVSNGVPDKQVIVFDCGIHAREWVSPASCLLFVEWLSTGYGTDAEVTSLVDTYDWIFSIVANPDGYAFTWGENRLWRKNRNQFGFCVGADPNRNFDAGFGGPGTSDNACADTYHGPSAFSEAESQAIRDILVANSGRVISTISIHSYSQLWMSPYGFSSALPADYDEMYRNMAIGVDALTATYGKAFEFGNIADTIYLAAGSTADYAYDTHGVVYAFALELRDTGFYGFQLPADQILATAQETFNGIKASVNAMTASKYVKVKA